MAATLKAEENKATICCLSGRVIACQMEVSSCSTCLTPMWLSGYLTKQLKMIKQERTLL